VKEECDIRLSAAVQAGHPRSSSEDCCQAGPMWGTHSESAGGKGTENNTTVPPCGGTETAASDPATKGNAGDVSEALQPTRYLPTQPGKINWEQEQRNQISRDLL